MSWIGLLLLLVALYLGFRLVGVVLKLALFVVALVIGYALLAPHMEWPSPGEIVWVLGPDTDVLGPEGVRLPEASQVRQRVVEGVAGAIAERVVPPLEPTPDAPAESLPAPCVEGAAGSAGGC